MNRSIKTPEIASTIAPPRHVMASVERGKLGKSERVALAGLACLDRGFLGAPIMVGSERFADGPKRDSFSGEQAKASPVSPYAVDVTATLDRAACSDDTVRPVITHEGRVKIVRTLTDGDAILPTLAVGQAEAVTQRPTDVAAPMVDVVARPQHIIAERDLVADLLATMGHKGTITPKLRTLALDVLAKREQDRAYIGR